MAENTLEVIAKIEMFRGLSLADQQHLASLLTVKSFNPNEAIFLQGDEGHGLYLIRSGKVKICTYDQQGNELIFGFLSSGDLLGEIALLDGLPRSASVIAIMHTNTLYLYREKFQDFLKSSPQACMDIMVNLCKTLRRLSTRLEEASFLNVSGRVARNLILISLNEEFPQNCIISQEELAKVVGASRVMVNKILNSFCDLGFITQERNKITILNQHELKRIGDYNLTE
ncbi:Crp/Fnr family transcriptional regulator [Chloroflexota bacterium]